MKRLKCWTVRVLGIPVLMLVAWIGLSIGEMITGFRVFPDAYANCTLSTLSQVPTTVQVGFYEEFPHDSWRLERLKLIDFPFTLAIAAHSKTEFETFRTKIRAEYPYVKDVYFWPVLKPTEGYYPGAFSDLAAVERTKAEAEDVPTLWDLEVPPGMKHASYTNWWSYQISIDAWLRNRTVPIDIWRSHTSMGLDPDFLRFIGMQFDPLTYPVVKLHLDLYQKGDQEINAERMARILNCGVSRYKERFIPSFGALADGQGTPDKFTRFETLRRDIQLSRAAGVSELWIFSASGITPDVITLLHESLPLETANPSAGLPAENH